MMTNVRFSQQVAYLSAHCASWAADSLTLPESHDEPLPEYVLERFLESIRGRLHHIEKWAREEPDSAPTPTHVEDQS